MPVSHIVQSKVKVQNDLNNGMPPPDNCIVVLS